jgi:hypothetical protein
MGCNCKKKNEQVARKYYVPATETEPAQIIESVEQPQIIVPEPQTKDEWYDQISKGLRKQDGQTRET